MAVSDRHFFGRPVFSDLAALLRVIRRREEVVQAHNLTDTLENREAN